ncbi:MAG TPA: DUF4870 domain-containing protein [Methylomirabilota bacterium]|nr:DUF4870 domain-containing protein [Methylomirabilota bacterium]
MEAPPPLNSPPLPAKPDSNEKLLIILCHVSLFLGVGLIFPLIIYLVKKGESEKITAHAREALNFHISLFIYGFCSVLLCVIFIGIPLLFALAIMALVLPIVAAVKASDGGFYRYPLTLRLVA